jgi:hypothetical protein
VPEVRGAVAGRGAGSEELTGSASRRHRRRHSRMERRESPPVAQNRAARATQRPFRPASRERQRDSASCNDCRKPPRGKATIARATASD